MRSFLIIVGLLWGAAWADTVVRCRLLRPSPSLNHAHDVRGVELVSYVNHFSLSNFLSLNLERDAGPLFFTRDGISTNQRSATLRFSAPVKQSKVIQAWVVVDRAPRQVVESRYFRASLYISDARAQKVLELNDPANNGLRVAPFDCSF